MDEEKLKKLTDLRDKIDPEVLKRVAKASGIEISAEAADEENEAESSSEEHEKPQQQISISSAVRSTQMSELKGMLKRQEARLKAEKQRLNKLAIRRTGFVLFDDVPLHSRKIQAYLGKMGYRNIATVVDPASFVRAAMDYISDESLPYVAVLTPHDRYEDYREMLRSESLDAILEEVAEITNLPVFIVLPADKSLAQVQGIDPKMTIAMSQSPEFNRKKVKRMLEALSEAEDEEG
ncbi:hypothetical protein HQ587_02755 [bacterium]|nr:hypothetical protein [bacterium]